jgi:DHA2 family multidrug resistance protein-like MFS transporter
MWIALVGCTIYAMGIMAVMATAGEMIMAVVPAERAGSAAATVEMGSELGGALGMAILGSIGGAVYGSSIALPGGLSAEDTGIAKETLGGAQAVSSGIGGDLGRQVLEAARSAFVDGMHAAAIGGMALMAVAAAVTLMTMRGVRTGAPKEPELEKAA